MSTISGNNPDQSIRIKRRRFSDEEDNKLAMLVQYFGANNWVLISHWMKNRTVRQCKERWELFLSPFVNRKQFTKEEDDLIIGYQKILGSQWKKISKLFLNRTEVSIKNRWILLQKELQKGIMSSQIEKNSQTHHEKAKIELNGEFEDENKYNDSVEEIFLSFPV
jgi:hypothetical protein